MKGFLDPLKLVFWCCLLHVLYLAGQPQPVAKFSFNNGSARDEISGNKARLVNAYFSKDRFGNDNSAIYISGSEYTYVNLGSFKTLKPETGTISLWLKLEDVLQTGKGANVNPVLLTKNGNENDFYEGYAIYYNMLSGKIGGDQATDSINQLNANSREPIRKNRWHHLTISYSDTLFSFYLNGRLEAAVKKKFKARFLERDSVMLGHTANKKNIRFIIGLVDDIEFYNRVLSDKEVVALYEAPNPNENALLLRWVLIGLGAVLLIILTVVYTRFRIQTAIKKEKEKSEQAHKALENELRVHRALMNPHFIFNSLNGLQDFILKREFDGANDYLVNFSLLLRKIMESNMSDTISLELEIELLRRYIEMEGMRFDEKIDFSIRLDPWIAPSVVHIPIMMLQPFVENTIWHGLLKKEGSKAIALSFERYEEKYIRCIIDDNGAGRKEKEPSATKKSLAIQFIRQRLDLLSRIHQEKYSLLITDKPGGTGTTVTITLPFEYGQTHSA